MLEDPFEQVAGYADIEGSARLAIMYVK